MGPAEVQDLKVVHRVTDDHQSQLAAQVEPLNPLAPRGDIDLGGHVRVIATAIFHYVHEAVFRLDEVVVGGVEVSEWDARLREEHKPLVRNI